MAKKKTRPRDLKKQRWAGIVAGVLALAMVASLAGIYLGQVAGGAGPSSPDQPAEQDPLEFLSLFEEEAGRLEEQLAGNPGDEAIIRELIDTYNTIRYFRQMAPNELPENEDVRDRLAELYRELIALKPEQAEHRLELVRFYVESGVGGRELETVVVELGELLRENPDPLTHLPLIHFLGIGGERELQETEIDWLKNYLEEKKASELADNEELFYFAILLGEYAAEPVRAEALLEEVIAAEDEESWVYLEASNYLQRLRDRGENEG